MILGLDVSTSSTGWAVLDSQGSLIEMGSFALDKLEGLFSKADAVNRGLLELRARFPEISTVSIEEPLQGFRRGLSSASTLLTLGRFNGMVSWQSFVVFGRDPTFFNSSVARKGLGITISKDRDTKDQIMEWVEVVTGKELPKRTVKAGKKKGETVYDKGVNDAADAYVMARAAYLLNRNDQPSISCDRHQRKNRDPKPSTRRRGSRSKGN